MDPRRFKQTILITGSVAPTVPLNKPPEDVRCETLPVAPTASRKEQWNGLVEFLSARAPCIYIPNGDFHRACAVGRLPPNVAVCAILHSDEDCYYESARTLAASWDAAVAVSQLVETECRRRVPSLGERLLHIPHGVVSAGRPAQRDTHEIRLLYCNRLVQYQKRVFDLPQICAHLRNRGLAFQLTVAGDGRDAAELRIRFSEAGLTSHVKFLGAVPRERVLALAADADFFLLPSDFEGLPISLLEAMGAGCIPIAYDIRSGVREVIASGRNGRLVTHGDTAAFARAIVEIAAESRKMARMCDEAIHTIRVSFNRETMCQAYTKLFERLGQQAAGNACRRRDGKIYLPADLRLWHRLLGRARAMIQPAFARH